MSAFRRRTAAAPVAAPIEGVRQASYNAPVPLLSTGVPALDDIMCGGGVLAGSMLLFVPCAETATGAIAELGAPRMSSELQVAHNDQRVSAAESYTDLLLAYTTAQGIASHHTTVVAGEAADTFVTHLMGRAEDPDGLNSDSLVPVEEEQSSEPTPEQAQRLKIAWRYDRLRAPQTAELANANNFCTTFDLTKRMSPRLIQAARSNHLLHTFHVETGGDALEGAWNAIVQAADQCKAIAAKAQAPVLRVVLRSFGSPAWSDERSGSDLVRFLLRVRSLARSLAMPTQDAHIPPIPCLISVSLSSFLMSSAAFEAGVNVPQRVAHLADGCIGLSSFAASPGLRTLFPDFTGALRVYCTPAIGTLVNPSLRASVLRGMGAGHAPVGSSAQAEGGAGGGENNLAFKLKRKRLVIETLHLDVEGGVSERRTKPVSGVSDVATTQHAVAASDAASAVAPSSEATDARSVAAQPTRSDMTEEVLGVAATPHAHPDTAAESVEGTHGDATSSHVSRAPVFGGLKGLRERGLRFAQQSRPQDLEF